MAPAEVVEVKHKDETLAFKCWEKDGLKLPLRVSEPDARFREIKELDYKDGDIIIASYPKVGKTLGDPDVVLFCVALSFTLRGASCVVLSCSLSVCFFCPFSMFITLLGEEGAGLCAYRAFGC